MISRTLHHTVLALIVFIWVVPFIALITTSLRSELASKTSGFWTAFTPTELGHRFGTHDKGATKPALVLTGNIFERLNLKEESFPITGMVKSVLFKGRIPDPDNPDKTKLIRKWCRLVKPWMFAAARLPLPPMILPGGLARQPCPDPKKLDVFIDQEPVFGAEAYEEVLFENKHVPNALISSFIVTIPATIIPITIAAFAAYAFAWMRFPGRDWLFVIVVSLMVVPTQLAFLPILQGFSGIASWAAAYIHG